MTDLSRGLRNVLDVVSEKTNRSLIWSVSDTIIIQACEDNNMPAGEVFSYLLQLEGLNMIKIGAKISGADFRMINITKKGLEERSNQALI